LSYASKVKSLCCGDTHNIESAKICAVLPEKY